MTFVVSNFVFNRGCGVFLLRMMVAEMTVYACSERSPPCPVFCNFVLVAEMAEYAFPQDCAMYVVLLGVEKLANMGTWNSEVE